MSYKPYRRFADRVSVERNTDHMATPFCGSQRPPTKAERRSERDARESEIQHAIVELLRRAGWYVRVFSYKAQVPKQMQGWPDVVAFKHGVCLLIECKRLHGSIRPGQAEFQDQMREHGGPNVRHIVARSVDDVLEAIGGK